MKIRLGVNEYTNPHNADEERHKDCKPISTKFNNQPETRDPRPRFSGDVPSSELRRCPNRPRKQAKRPDCCEQEDSAAPSISDEQGQEGHEGKEHKNGKQGGLLSAREYRADQPSRRTAQRLDDLVIIHRTFTQRKTGGVTTATQIRAGAFQ